MKALLFGVLMLGATASVATGQELVTLLPSPIQLSSRIGPLEFDGKPSKYDDPRLGVSYGYNAPGAALTIYVYDAGVAEVPDGADSIAVCREFEDAKQGVRGSPAYGNTRFRSEHLVRLAPPEDAPLAREAVFEMDREGRHLISYLWITGVAKHFVKLRFTMVAPPRDEVLEARRTVLDAVGAAMRPHLAAVAAAAGKKSGDGAALTVTLNQSGGADMITGLSYLMVLSAMAEKEPESAPACGGEYVPAFGKAVAAWETALAILDESGGGSRFARTLAAANKAGMIEEFVWIELHREQWGATPPDGLALGEYAAWRKKNMKNIRIPDFGAVTFDRPRPLPLEDRP
ncbi:MAG: hypothetical protein KF822_04375 [Steroidobacteraceae bacterium]|nr:hypothetical protein [Steroidobacteraceae bacterium]